MDLAIIIAVGALVLAALVWGVFQWRRSADGKTTYAAADTLLNSEERAFREAVRKALNPEFDVFAKVSLADVISPDSNIPAPARERALGRLRAEHADFVVCRPDNGHILGTIDLVTREARDKDREFYDTVMEQAGLPILHIEAKAEYNPAVLRQQALATFRPSMNAAAVRALVRRGTVWLRIDGHGTFQNSAAVRAFTERMIEEGHQSFAFDLHGCEMMDSTFLGTVTNLALRLREEPGGRLGFARVNAGIESLFGRYGLDRVLAFQGFEAAPPAPEEMEQLDLSMTKEFKRGTMVEAHEALAASSPENEERFREALDFLKRKDPE